MLGRTLCQALRRLAVPARQLSTSAAGSGPRVRSSTADADGVAVVALCSRPVNALSVELLCELDAALLAAEQDRQVRAVVLASDLPKIFTAGLDLLEMYQPQQTRLCTFWRTLQGAWMRLYGFRKPIVAAIEGESPAGGCLLAMSCDHRVMAQGAFRIGLNESQIGIVAPFWFADVMCNTVGQRQAERLLQLGHLAPAEEALRLGLVDELVAPDQVLARARAVAVAYSKIPNEARHLTKMLLRQATLDRLKDGREADVLQFQSFVNTEKVQAMLGKYVASLKAKQQQ